jgi:hypothetical protein
MKKIIVFCFGLLALIPMYSYAHPGNTAADGMHYCHTNCDYWGVPWGQRHGHGGGSYSSYSAPVQYEPIYKNNSDCGVDSFAYLGTCYYLPNNAKKSFFSGFTCNYGYEEVGYGLSKQCLKEVENGYRIGSTIFCDYGYKLYGNMCLKGSSSYGGYSSSLSNSIYNTSSSYSCPKNSSNSATNSSRCTCNTGYTVNNNKDACVKISKSTNDKLCRADFGSKSQWNNKYSDDGSPYCVCKKGYEWNTTGTKCVKESNT